MKELIEEYNGLKARLAEIETAIKAKKFELIAQVSEVDRLIAGKRKPGRKPKVVEVAAEPPIKKRRGRPPKIAKEG